MDSKKQKDMPNQEENTRSNQDMNEQGEKGGMSQYDQNSNDFSNESGLTEEIDEIEVE
jgi:hypothetical protein